MRTTVTIDPDVEALLRRAMKARGLSFKELLNRSLRAGLQPEMNTTRPPRRYRLRTYRMGFRPELRLDKALTLAASIEDEEIARKMSLRK